MPFSLEAQDAKLCDVVPSYKDKDLSLDEEADALGIPHDQRLYFKSRLKWLNRDYQDGALTKTEYVQRKRELINLCK